jgi:hypothetical protein
LIEAAPAMKTPSRNCFGVTAHPTGITINPANVSDIWIVDNGTNKVYQYIGAAGRTSGSQNAGATFALNPYDTNPQGIADPPPAGALIAQTPVVVAQATEPGNTEGLRSVGNVIWGPITNGPNDGMPLSIPPERNQESRQRVDDMSAVQPVNKDFDPQNSSLVADSISRTVALDTAILDEIFTDQISAKNLD